MTLCRNGSDLDGRDTTCLRTYDVQLPSSRIDSHSKRNDA